MRVVGDKPKNEHTLSLAGRLSDGKVTRPVVEMLRHGIIHRFGTSIWLALRLHEIACQQCLAKVLLTRKSFCHCNYVSA